MADGEARRRLGDVREALACHDVRRAGQEAWAAAAIAASVEDVETLQALLDLASVLEQQTSGRERKEAERLSLYVSHSLRDALNGTRPKSVFERMIRRQE
jgi:hypothetical protein